MLTTIFMLFSSRPDRRLISIQPALVTMSFVLTKVTPCSAAAWASAHPWRFIADKWHSRNGKRRNP